MWGRVGYERRGTLGRVGWEGGQPLGRRNANCPFTVLWRSGNAGGTLYQLILGTGGGGGAIASQR